MMRNLSQLFPKDIPLIFSYFKGGIQSIPAFLQAEKGQDTTVPTIKSKQKVLNEHNGEQRKSYKAPFTETKPLTDVVSHEASDSGYGIRYISQAPVLNAYVETKLIVRLWIYGARMWLPQHMADDKCSRISRIFSFTYGVQLGANSKTSCLSPVQVVFIILSG